jgi:hypothetical protein
MAVLSLICVSDLLNSGAKLLGDFPVTSRPSAENSVFVVLQDRKVNRGG